MVKNQTPKSKFQTNSKIQSPNEPQKKPWNLESGTWNFFSYQKRSRGASFIDAVVGTALMLLVFIGLFGVIRMALLSVGLGKAKTGAVALANEQVEYLRSLPYNSVAVLGGIPAGAIPATEVVTLNNIAYTRRTFVQFIDSPADGVGAADVNGIQADYKVAKVDVLWMFRDMERTVSLITSIVPKGIETLDGGGTLVVNVVDAGGLPVSSADITITNDAVSPSISISTFSGVDGVAYFPGAPTSTAYQIITTKDGYSTDQTYTASVSNPNPNPGTLTVVGDTITSSTFRIDRLSDLTIRSFDEIRSATWTDTFADLSLVEIANQIDISSGDARLLPGETYYFSPGTITATSVAPTYLAGWNELVFDTTTPLNTSVEVKLYYDTGTGFDLVPDATLPGNAAGFTVSPVALSALATSTYGRLQARATLSSSDGLLSPTLAEWHLTYDEGPLPRPNTSFSILGAKTIGTDGGGAPIYKYQDTFTTDAAGVYDLPGIEWDVYRITKGAAETGIMLAEACPFQPFGVNPGVTQTIDFIVAPASTHSLLVYVTDDSNVPLAGATIEATKTGYDVTQESSTCGQTLFRNLSSGTYTLTVSKSGYTPQTITGVDVSGASTYSVLLNP